ncbi:hypothetical protein [Paenibacillus eucommiae]|uniref:Uncharacterized protein n=1 Tax=Paenibacillus eucommiae TaxID=1355755 RepID=A0ABS4IXL2_9BACL|nr:hypothetical protein [Paenibacillus eucommiae]MBP1992322.1 hypothetical protein [Paenibacillus eucommiae]
MGNRTFLTVNEIEAVNGPYEEVAFETNNFLAPIWFSLVSQEHYQRYREQLLTAWEAVQPYLDNEDADAIPEWDAFYEALNLHIPWTEAAAQMRQSLPVTLARFPALGPYMAEWLETLSTHVQSYQSPVLHLELAQHFDFYGVPLPYLASIEDLLVLWWNPDELWFKRYNEKLNDYLLGGEHLPKRRREEERTNVEAMAGSAEIGELDEHDEPDAPITPDRPDAPDSLNTQQIEEVPAAGPTHPQKRSSKRLQELYIWLLAILSAALFIGTLALTSSMWLAVLVFLFPAICIILWEILKRPKKIPSTIKNRPAPSSGESQITYYDGISPIKLLGVDAVNLDKKESFTVPWHHIVLAQVNSSNQVVLILHTEFESLYPPVASVVVNDKLAAEQIASATNAIAGLARLHRR